MSITPIVHLFSFSLAFFLFSERVDLHTRRRRRRRRHLRGRVTVSAHVTCLRIDATAVAIDFNAIVATAKHLS